MSEGQKMKEEFDLRKQQTIKIMQERVISVDERDQQVWNLITDVPMLKGPWQYICFILNVIIPGTGTMICSCFYE